jgi:predicted ATPase
LAEGLMASGRAQEAEETVAATIDRCLRSGEAWCLPELMRIRALALSSTDRAAEANAVLAEALSLARAQGARFWQLRLAAGDGVLQTKTE